MTRSRDLPDNPAAPAPGSVKVQKRADRPAAPNTRQKDCATCGRTFTLGPGEKFYLCPACYQKAHGPKRKKAGASILTRIQCASCGAEEYLSFVPTDPAQALCKACFAKQKRELRTS